MEIGALGFINSLISSGTKEISAGSQQKDFISILNAQIQGNSSEVSSSIASDSKLSNADLKSLIDFLQTDDILDLDNGLNLLDQTLSSGQTNLLKLIQDFLGLSDSSIQEAIQSLKKLISQSSIANNQLNESLSAIGNQDDEKDHQTEDTVSSLAALMSMIAAMPASELKSLTTNDFAEVVKAAKLLDLISKHEDGNGNKGQWNELLNKVSEKIETFLQSQTQKQPERLEFLQKTFAPVAAELNQKESTRQNSVFTENLSRELQNAVKESEKNSNIVTSVKGESGVQNKAEFLNGQAIQLQQMSKPEQLTLMLEKNGRPVSTEQMIQQFESILSKSSLMKSGDAQTLLLKLNPEHLGSLRIQLIQNESSFVAKIMTSTGAAKDALDAQLQHLKQAFSAQNIPVDRIEVTHQVNQNESFLNQEQQGKEQQRQNPRNQKDDQDQNEGFQISFEDALLNIEV